MNPKLKKVLKNDKVRFAIGAVVGAIVIYCGYSQEINKVENCRGTYTKYVTAEYSETTYGTDAEGMPTSDTSYWSEPASPRYTAITVNGELTQVIGNFNPTESNGYWVPDMPGHDTSMRRDYDFDNFQFHNDKKLEIRVSDSTFTEELSKMNACVAKLDSHIFVKTWYGISYGSDF